MVLKKCYNNKKEKGRNRVQTIIGYDVSFLVGNTLFELNIHENEPKEINDSLAHNHYTNELLFVLDGYMSVSVSAQRRTL